MDQHDWVPRRGAESLVDLDHRREHFLLERPIGRELGARGCGDQQEGEGLAHLRVSLPELAQCTQTLRNSLGVVHAIDAESQPLPVARVPLAESLDERGALGRARQLLVALHIDADGKDRDIDSPAIVVHGERVRIDLRLGHQLGDAAEEVQRVALGVKLDEIVAEEPPQEGLVDAGG